MVVNRLDIDQYKLTMKQFAFHRYPKVSVRYGFTNRTKSVELPKIVPLAELSNALEAASVLQYSQIDVDYLRIVTVAGERLFAKDFLASLRSSKLPPYELSVVDGQYQLETEGPWPEAIDWETIMLSTINELYTHELAGGAPGLALAYSEGRRRLKSKIEILQRYPEARLIEFGTRRRCDQVWQDQALGMLVEGLLPGQLLGTSNVNLARKYGLQPMGTVAHETKMIYAALAGSDDVALRASHGRFLDDWWDEFDLSLSVALTDTFTSQFFFDDFGEERARKWKGLRQDSGDPFDFGERTIRFYQELGIDPKEKLIVFSDGLDVEMIVALLEQFSGRVQVAFGWGTNLTNDCGFAPLSLVVKAISANGVPTVKLSDNLAKALGRPEDVARYERVFGHSPVGETVCRY